MTTTRLEEYDKQISELEREKLLLEQKERLLIECKKSIEFLKNHGYDEKELEILFGVSNYDVEEDTKKLNEKLNLIREKCGLEHEKIIRFGSYSISDLLPILRDIVSFITGKKWQYKIRKKNDTFGVAGDSMHTEYVYATFEQAILESEGKKIIIEESDKPGYYDRGSFTSKFHDTVYIVQINWKTNRFEIPYSSEKYFWPEYIGEFLVFATNYRMEHDLTTVTKKELKEIKDQYMASFGIQHRDKRMKEELELKKYKKQKVQLERLKYLKT